MVHYLPDVMIRYIVEFRYIKSIVCIIYAKCAQIKNISIL